MTGAPAAAGHPGEVPSQHELADRLAILNLLGIYGAYANEGDFEGWSSLFAEDAVFEIALPGEEHVVDKRALLAGERHIFSIYRERLRNPSDCERRLFMMSNCHVRSQEPRQAQIGMTLALVRTGVGPSPPRIEGTGTYTGILIKPASRWLIHRWRVQTDSPPEPMLSTAAHPDAAWER